MKMWSGRFRQPLDPEFERWQRSFPFDCRLLKYELEASRAYARALRKVGVLSAEELASILFGLDQIAEKAAASASFLEDDQAEDVHHFVEKQLTALIGDAGLKLHSGRSRNEQIATLFRSLYPGGKNYVLSPNMKSSYERRYGKLKVDFISIRQIYDLKWK